MIPPPPRSSLFPYRTLFRSRSERFLQDHAGEDGNDHRRRVQQGGGSRHASARDGELVGELEQGDEDAASEAHQEPAPRVHSDRKSTRLNSSHLVISYAVFCL